MEKLTAKQRFEALGKFIYSSDEGTFLGRGGKNWGEIGLFYLVYYICLAGFFSATMAVFYQTLPNDEPALMGDSSLLKGNPGMGFRPMPDLASIVVRSKRDAKHQTSYVASIKEVLDKYESSSGVNCIGEQPRPNAKEPCNVDMTKLMSKCNPGNAFGMNDSKPCVLLKLNKIYGWSPKVWQIGEDKVPNAISQNYTSDRIWIKCYGRKDWDSNALNDDIEYFPMQGYGLAYFPFLKQKGYLAPLVFVKFNNVVKRKTIKVVCRAYAKNIEYDRNERQGGVEFELNVDE